MSEILKAEHLSVEFEDGSFRLAPVDISLKKGEILAVIGESGSGKSTLAKALVHMNAANARVKGKIIVRGNDLYSITEKKLKSMRMRDFAIAMQNSRELLNPMLSVRSQLNETLIRNHKGKEKERRIKELTELTGFPQDALEKFPSELSGGMIQKVLIMNAIALKPALVILDEPTSALDSDSADAIVDLIHDIQEKEGTAFLIITHDLRLAFEVSSRVMVFYQGCVVEEGFTKQVFHAPHHPYTRGLFQSSVDINLYRDIWGIRRARADSEHDTFGCPFYNRCHQCIEKCRTVRPVLQVWGEDRNWKIACNRGGIVKILEGKEISISYGSQKVLDQANICICSSEVVALIGPSGSGKSTLAHILSGVLKPDDGTVFYENQKADFSLLHRIFGGMQIVHQDPDSALNPNMTVMDAVVEPLMINAVKTDMKEEVARLLEAVGLYEGKELLNGKVKRLSGGQKQKVMLARALALKPKLLIADEITSMLDASSKANLLRLLKQIQNANGLAMLFITHDLNSARKISDRIYCMSEDGKINEVSFD